MKGGKFNYVTERMIKEDNIEDRNTVNTYLKIYKKVKKLKKRYAEWGKDKNRLVLDTLAYDKGYGVRCAASMIEIHNWIKGFVKEYKKLDDTEKYWIDDELPTAYLALGECRPVVEVVDTKPYDPVVEAYRKLGRIFDIWEIISRF